MIEISEYLKSPATIGTLNPNGASFTTIKRTSVINTQDDTEVVNLSFTDGRYQPKDTELTAIAGLTSAADKAPYFTGSGAASLFSLTEAGRALLDDIDAAAQRATLGLSSTVAGPVSSTTNAIPRYTSTDGAAIKNSLVSISDAGTLNIPTGQTYDIAGSPHTHDYAASTHNHDSTYAALSHTHSTYATQADIIALAIALGG